MLREEEEEGKVGRGTGVREGELVGGPRVSGGGIAFLGSAQLAERVVATRGPGLGQRSGGCYGSP